MKKMNSYKNLNIFIEKCIKINSQIIEVNKD